MKGLLQLVAALVLPVLAACDDLVSDPAPPPQRLTAEAVGHYCGMNLSEHTGPKGQIILSSQSTPLWFSSARDAFSYTMLDEEAKDIRAVYVSDMGKATSWEDPGADNWVEARQAFFVIGSHKHGGMGAPETVPFSDYATAERFAAEYGGKAVTFKEVPQAYVLGSEPNGNGVHGHESGEPKAGSR